MGDSGSTGRGSRGERQHQLESKESLSEDGERLARWMGYFYSNGTTMKMPVVEMGCCYFARKQRPRNINVAVSYKIRETGKERGRETLLNSVAPPI